MKRATAIIYCFIKSICISIHALVKRATLDCIVLRLFYVISIHALVKRATVVALYHHH